MKQLVQYGIVLDLSHPSTPTMGIYNRDVHLDWIERLKRAFIREKFADECEERFEASVLFEAEPELKKLLQSVWSDFDQNMIIRPSHAEKNDGTRAHKIAPEMNRDTVQIPVISYLHEKELMTINQRIVALEPTNENPAIKGLYDFNQLSKNVIEAWFIENELKVPSLDIKENREESYDDSFRLDEDSSLAFKMGKEYSLTPNQYRVISYLYETWLKDPKAWKSSEAIKKATNIKSKMYQIFKMNLDVWNELIDRPPGKRKYRLKI
ncbi:MAG: hypothetical protein IIA59_12490 [Candidatus Marinimicrobia bacterium]|nr:hypothetical protein [Candidatus Neomarinimicrobiota bacterium]